MWWVWSVLGVFAVLCVGVGLWVWKTWRDILGVPVKGITSVPLSTLSSLIHSHREKGMRLLHKTHGRMVQVEGTLFLSDPSVIKTVLMQQDHTKVRHPVYRDIAKKSQWASYGVLNMDSDDAWKNTTRAMLPVFHASNVAKFASHMHDAAMRHAETIHKAGGAADLVATMRAISADVLMTWGFGLNPASTEATALHKALIAEGKVVHDGTLMRKDNILSQVVASVFRSMKYNKAAAALKSAWDAALLVPQADGAINFVTGLQSTRVPLTTAQVQSQLSHVYGAHKAIGLEMAFGVWALTRTPSNSTKDSAVVAKIRAELDRVLGGRAFVGKEDVANLPYFNMVLNEVNRMYPVVWGCWRTTGPAINLPGTDVTLPPKSHVVVNLEALHRDPELWNDPDTFNPDRFESKPTPFSFVPFLLGQRMCAGMPLAKFEFVCVLGSLLRNYDVEITTPELVQHPSIYTGVQQPLAFRLHKR